MSKTSKFLCIGPGGRKCNCCFPAPGSKSRKNEYRSAKRKERRHALRNEHMAYGDESDLLAVYQENDGQQYDHEEDDNWLSKQEYDPNFWNDRDYEDQVFVEEIFYPEDDWHYR